MSRRHRWIRGDWQIARWLLPDIPIPNARLSKNPLSLLSRWKIFDNLRRSLMASALTLLLLLGWTVLPAHGFWTLAVIGILVIPALIAAALNAFRKPADVTPGAAPCGRVGRGWPASRSGSIHARLPALRSVFSAWMRWCAPAGGC